MKTKKLTSVLLASLIIASLAGCGASDAKTDAKTESTASQKAETKTETKSEGKAVEMEFFALKPECVTVMDSLLAKFHEENPNITIKQTSVDDGETVLVTRMSADDMPDLLNTFPAEEKFKSMFADERITELTDQPFMSNIQDSMLKLSAYEGKQYALPMTLSAYGIYYRTDLFEQNGIAEPKTYAELMTACKTLKDAGIDAFALPNKDVGNCAQRLERIIGILNNDSNAEFKKIKAGEEKVEDSKTIREFAQFCADVVQYSTPDHMGLDYESGVSDVVNGKAAMMISGTWMLSTLQKANPDIKIKLMPFPNPLAADGEKAKVPVNIDTSYSLSSDCKYQDEGLKFIEFMSKTENAQMYYETDGNVNMVKGVTFDKEQHMDMKKLMDESNMFLTQVNFWPTGLREELRPASQQIYMDGNVDAFVQSFGAAIDKLYK